MNLLAKSKNSKLDIAARTLKEHIDDCLYIFSFLKEAFPKAADISGYGDIFWEILKACIVCHDLGKAHKEFQKLLNGQPNEWNSQRHELFSIPFINALSDFDKKLINIIELVVAGHHKDFERLREALRYYESDSFGMLETIDEETESFEQAFVKNVDITEALEIVKNYKIKIGLVQAKPINGLIHLYNKKPCKQENEDFFKLMLLFGGLKWCDHLGSARVTELQKLSDIDFAFLQKQQIALQNDGHDFYHHQVECGKVAGNLILNAPTGSGKTESAFLWLQNQLKITGQGRVFYVLPFTASINAMYERLNKSIGNAKVGMLHGKLNDYLNNYFDDLQYNVQAKKDNIQNIKEKFRSIVTPVKVTTPFQLLKHLFGLKGYEQGIFEMTGAYLIFDEIHAYSPDVFAQIKVLLEFTTKYLQAKVIIMTATMPGFLQKTLEESIGQFSLVKANEMLYLAFRRHKVVLKDGLLTGALDEIKDQLMRGGKILVVCNTVRSAQSVFSELIQIVPKDEAILLHGSFTGTDRAKKEKDLMRSGIKLLVGTQAIEVSLDIDYDIIYTEPAPIDALIQRFGRINRKREKLICTCFVFKEHNEADEYIYNKTKVEKTLIALEKIVNENEGIIDEALLQTSIDEVYCEWDEEDKRVFDEQYHYLSEALLLLTPMFKNKHTEEDFYKQFDGVKVLPQKNKEAYENYLSEFDFINAESLKIQIRKGRFAQWIKNDFVKKDLFAFSKNSKINIEQYYITNKKYTSELGLIANEEDPWKTSEIF